MQLFLDTNIWLDFYRVKSSRKLIDDLAKKKDSLLIHEQVVAEFRKNRFKLIHEEVEELQRTLKGLSIRSSYIVDEVSKLVVEQGKKAKELESCIQQVIDSLSKYLEDPFLERIYATLDNWFDGKTCKLLNTSSDDYKNAINRRELRKPPESDSGTLGDQVIWESLLVNCKDDLFYVTRDRVFHKYKYLLSVEFGQRTGKAICFFDKLSTALERFGIPANDDLKTFENSASAKERRWQLVSKDNSGIVVTDGQHTGVMYNIGGICPSCGSNGPWNGVMCLNCFDLLDD